MNELEQLIFAFDSDPELRKYFEISLREHLQAWEEKDAQQKPPEAGWPNFVTSDDLPEEHREQKPPEEEKKSVCDRIKERLEKFTEELEQQGTWRTRKPML